MIFRPSFFLILFFWLSFFSYLFQVSVWCIGLYLEQARHTVCKPFLMRTIVDGQSINRKICSELETDTSTIPTDAWCSKNEKKKYDLQICLKVFFLKLGTRYLIWNFYLSPKQFLYIYLWSLGNSVVCMYLGMESFSLTNEIGDFNARVMACQFRFEP